MYEGEDVFEKYKGMKPYLEISESEFDELKDMFNKDELKERLAEVAMTYPLPYGTDDYSEIDCIADYNKLKGIKWASYLKEGEWFPRKAKNFLKEYKFPVFPDDFAYYLLKDNKTLVMISAVKSLKVNFKYDIVERKLDLYPTNGKFDFIISSIAKDCGHYKFKDNYRCSFYKPLISSTLIK